MSPACGRRLSRASPTRSRDCLSSTTIRWVGVAMPSGSSKRYGAPIWTCWWSHDLFLSPTAQLADYVLPASHWLEKPSFSTGLGYMGTAGDYAAASHAAIEPEYGHRNDYEPVERPSGVGWVRRPTGPRPLRSSGIPVCDRPDLSFHTLAQQTGPWMSAAPRYGKFTGQSAQGDKPRFGTPLRAGGVALNHPGRTRLPGPARLRGTGNFYAPVRRLSAGA